MGFDDLLLISDGFKFYFLLGVIYLWTDTFSFLLLLFDDGRLLSFFLADTSFFRIDFDLETGLISFAPLFDLLLDTERLLLHAQ